MTMTEATSNPFSSLKKTLVDNDFVPLAVYLISMEVFSDSMMAERSAQRFKILVKGPILSSVARF